MQLARFLNKLFKKDGFILIDANLKRYIIGTPENKDPIILKILDKKLHFKLLLDQIYILGRLILMVILKLRMELSQIF